MKSPKSEIRNLQSEIKIPARKKIYLSNFNIFALYSLIN